MNFEALLTELKSGKTFERISLEAQVSNVECSDNFAYLDDDLEYFLFSLGCSIVSMENNCATIYTYDGRTYKLPYKELPNRFDNELPNEIIIHFDSKYIVEVI